MKNNMMKTLLTVSALSLTISAGCAAFSVNAAAAQEADKYQRISYTNNSGKTFNILISANDEETEFHLQFDYYGLDAGLDAEKTGNDRYYIVNGDFFQTSGQEVIKKAVALDNWIEIR